MDQPPETSERQRTEDQSITDNETQKLLDDSDCFLKIAGNKYYILIPGKTLECHETIRNFLQHTLSLKEVESVEECDVIVVLCAVVSRTGTDIDAALNELNKLSESKPAIFTVLHHTFDPEKTVPDSSRCVNRENTLTVDLLFHEDKGLLDCMKNNEALGKIKNRLQVQDTGNIMSSFFNMCRSCLCCRCPVEPEDVTVVNCVLCVLMVSVTDHQHHLDSSVNYLPHITSCYLSL
ncbi:uncharacterized protein [Misgurnus anguillicaudatus]|uniref:uncharacterized protein n=1 Tax=Misgurnus anguillicaudatus TaxID=75329 RepID=UPI003CCF0FA7